VSGELSALEFWTRGCTLYTGIPSQDSENKNDLSVLANISTRRKLITLTELFLLFVPDTGFLGCLTRQVMFETFSFDFLDFGSALNKLLSDVFFKQTFFGGISLPWATGTQIILSLRWFSFSWDFWFLVTSVFPLFALGENCLDDFDFLDSCDNFELPDISVSVSGFNIFLFGGVIVFSFFMPSTGKLDLVEKKRLRLLSIWQLLGKPFVQFPFLQLFCSGCLLLLTVEVDASCTPFEIVFLRVWHCSMELSGSSNSAFNLGIIGIEKAKDKFDSGTLWTETRCRLSLTLSENDFRQRIQKLSWNKKKV